MLNTMTVGELMDALRRADPSKPVVVGDGECPIDTVAECTVNSSSQSEAHSVVKIFAKGTTLVNGW